ncbi:Hypothetical protein Minf_1152 [Methylacidiphilum infernorum V4]|uniref:Uncharacterized protein n=1 Tax=Methylacidiphilum infernorum (isolate V4) TaxID=481448 RepID=B3DV54_METI4|nr:Hypothetical protein Minf_1152 [Methylacidiphilum infernorum V4]
MIDDFNIFSKPGIPRKRRRKLSFGTWESTTRSFFQKSKKDFPKRVNNPQRALSPFLLSN